MDPEEEEEEGRVGKCCVCMGRGFCSFPCPSMGNAKAKEFPLLTVGRERGGGGRTDLRGVGEGGGWTHRRQLRFTLRDGSLFLLSFSVRPSVGGDSKVTDRPTLKEREREEGACCRAERGLLGARGAGGAHE